MGKRLLLVLLVLLLCIPGFAQHWDTDGDGIADSTDGCPYVAGPAQYNGCPGMPFEIAFDGPVRLYFRNGSTLLDAATIRDLRKLAQTAKQDTTLFIYLYGRSDNTGSPEANMRLSSGRANQCRQYLIGQGVAAYRVMAYGYGGEDPLADNNNPSGRRQNRSVTIGLKRFRK